MSIKAIIDAVPAAQRDLADLALQVVRLRQALGYFVADPRFQVAVGGNPHAVSAMIDRAKAVYEETEI